MAFVSSLLLITHPSFASNESCFLLLSCITRLLKLQIPPTNGRRKWSLHYATWSVSESSRLHLEHPIVNSRLIALDVPESKPNGTSCPSTEQPKIQKSENGAEQESTTDCKQGDIAVTCYYSLLIQKPSAVFQVTVNLPHKPYRNQVTVRLERLLLELEHSLFQLRCQCRSRFKILDNR